MVPGLIEPGNSAPPAELKPNGALESSSTEGWKVV
jgi:hypothetical protein